MAAIITGTCYSICTHTPLDSIVILTFNSNRAELGRLKRGQGTIEASNGSTAHSRNVHVYIRDQSFDLATDLCYIPREAIFKVAVCQDEGINKYELEKRRRKEWELVLTRSFISYVGKV